MQHTIVCALSTATPRRLVLALSTTAALAALTAAPAFAIEVKQDVKVKLTPAAVWHRIGPFCAIKTWHPAITGCEQKRDGSKVVRILTLKDGGKITETLLSENRYTYTYDITDSPLPVKNYKATLAAKPATDGDLNASTVSWTANFDAKDKPDAEAKSVIEGIFKAGLENIQKVSQSEMDTAAKAKAEREAKFSALKLKAMEDLAKAKAMIAEKAKKVADAAKEAYEKAKAQIEAAMKK